MYDLILGKMFKHTFASMILYAMVRQTISNLRACEGFTY